MEHKPPRRRNTEKVYGVTRICRVGRVKRVPSLKESWLSRGVFRIFSDGFSLIAHIPSTSKSVGFVFQSAEIRLPFCRRSFFL